jgi:hypothetical protein
MRATAAFPLSTAWNALCNDNNSAQEQQGRRILESVGGSRSTLTLVGINYDYEQES